MSWNRTVGFVPLFLNEVRKICQESRYEKVAPTLVSIKCNTIEIPWGKKKIPLGAKTSQLSIGLIFRGEQSSTRIEMKCVQHDEPPAVLIF